MWISSGGHFEIQYGGHKERISSGPISEKVRNILVHICAIFGACITKRTIGLLHCCTTRTKKVTVHVYNKSLAVAEMGDRLATIDMSRKVGLLCPFPWGSWVPSNTIVGHRACAETYLRTK